MIFQLCDAQGEISPISDRLVRIYMHAFVLLGYTGLVDLFSFQRTRCCATHNELANDIQKDVICDE